MSMYNLIELIDIYLRTSVSLLRYYRDEPALNNSADVIDFSANNNNTNVSFKFIEKITGQTDNNGLKGIEKMVLLKYLSNFRRTLEMPLISC